MKLKGNGYTFKGRIWVGRRREGQRQLSKMFVSPYEHMKRGMLSKERICSRREHVFFLYMNSDRFSEGATGSKFIADNILKSLFFFIENVLTFQVNCLPTVFYFPTKMLESHLKFLDA